MALLLNVETTREEARQRALKRRRHIRLQLAYQRLEALHHASPNGARVVVDSAFRAQGHSKSPCFRIAAPKTLDT
jgi:hypothetical protein